MSKPEEVEGEVVHLSVPQPPEDTISKLGRHIKDKVGFPNAALIVGEIKRIAGEIPHSVNSLSPESARELAATFLKGMDLCGELYAVATGYELKMELNKKKEHAIALVVRSQTFQCKTARDKESYADMDVEYLEAADRFIEAKYFRIMIENKREDFSKAHYLMRKIADENVILPDPNSSSPNGYVGWDGKQK